MELNFRSIQERSSTYFTHYSPSLPSPSPFHFSYVTHQSIRAGLTTPELGHGEFHRHPNDFREAMQFQRELEKKRIRAEIIAEEIARRRILEEEVRREMIMERQMAMRFEPRVPLLTNFERRERFGGIGFSPHREVGFRGFETLPFQRDLGASGATGLGNGTPSSATLPVIEAASASEVARDKVIILAKPTVSAADLKRKATSEPDGATARLISAGSKKQKTKDDWSCALCRVSATSERGLNEHLQGKKHKARERQMVTQKTGFGTTPLPKKSTPTNSKHVKAPGLKSSPSSKDKDGKAEDETDNRLPNKMEKSVEKKKKRGAAKPKKSPVTAKPLKKFRFWCEACKVGAYSEKVMNTHKNGKRHLATISELNQAGETTTNPGRTSTENFATEKTKEETVEEQVEFKEATADNNPTTTDNKDKKASESICNNVTAVEDENKRVVVGAC